MSARSNNTVDDGGEVTVPIPGTPEPGEILDGMINFVLDHPIPVAGTILAIIIVRAIQRGGVTKGIFIGILLAVAYLFIAGIL